MARIVNMQALLPPDIEFVMGDETYLAPGDPPLPLLLRIFDVWEKAQSLKPDDDAMGLEQLRELDTLMVELLQIRDPKVTANPFGMSGVMLAVGELFTAYGYAAEGGDGDLPPTTGTTANRSTRRASRTPKKRST